MESPQTLAVPLAQLEAQAVQGLEDAGEALDRLNAHALAFVRERPITCVVGAAALGFLIGKLAARG